MVCGYGDKLSASSSASSLMLFQLSPAHLQAFSLYLQVQRDHSKELTPFMLQMLNELTDGKSLDSSILLLKAGGQGAAEVLQCTSYIF